MKPGEKQFWRVANATIQDFLQLQIQENGTLQPMELVALDGYPLAQTRKETTILIPPAGRAEFIVQAPPAGGKRRLLHQRLQHRPNGKPGYRRKARQHPDQQQRDCRADA